MVSSDNYSTLGSESAGSGGASAQEGMGKIG
jgi:hypothetical protein